jgi:hypothetical protein
MRRAGRRVFMPPFEWAILGAALIAVLAMIAGRLSVGQPDTERRIPDSVGLPRFAHVYLVILENKSPDELADPRIAPYFTSLIRNSGSTTNYQAVARPSQPNYLALFSGSTHGVDDNNPRNVTATTIVDQLEANGLTWHVYAENVPPNCFTGEFGSDDADGAGIYARKHEPAISFTSIRQDPGRCARITDLSSFSAGAANFNLVVPNLCHDMHDCSVAEGDRFLNGFVTRLLADPDWTADDLLVVTFDESASRDRQNGVKTILAGSGVPAGFTSDLPYDHYSLLRTFQDSWGLGCLAESCEATAMTDFFRP